MKKTLRAIILSMITLSLCFGIVGCGSPEKIDENSSNYQAGYAAGYAVGLWTKTVTVKFNVAGGKTLADKSREIIKGNKIGKLPKTSRSDFAFKGWYTKKSGGKKITASTKVKSDRTFYAHWKAKKTSSASVASASKYYPSESDDYTVYITNTGAKYHRSSCRYLWNSKIAISRSDAWARGYDPCSVCNP